ncbi:Flagellar hook-associated protein 2 [Pigmentiphaga humi]|uniref:Flagellar hook-associated protein 2 n=1 Tax=Pigmentiphaga humi TaxID=2478468 RepID=A0A3P4B0V2_9BURK|nr:flagellar filament capping protein FliD [Pigmentiphaga humi]VCU69927.1 Flagellar hook-associated protein 2 [Pigmentiphaga humi]
MASVGSALGVGSGLELSTLLTNLMNAEKVPLVKLQQQESTVQSKISAFGQLKSSLSSLLTAVNGLTEAKFNGMTGTSSDTGVATVSATNAASKASHTLEVTSLALAEKAVSSALDDDAQLRSGTLTFTFGSVKEGAFVAGEGETKTVTIGAGNNTLAGVRDAINQAAMGVTASLINDGSGSRLVLTSSDTGAAHAFKIDTAESAGGSGEALSFLDYDPATSPAYSSTGTNSGMSRLQAGADAQFKLDGLSVSSASNTVTTVLAGVTLTLQKAGTSTVAIGTNASSGTSALQALVSAYNSFLSTANSLALNTPSETKGEASSGNGPLAGDSLVRDVVSRIRGELFSPLAGATGPYTSLSSLGVSFQNDGTLKLDTERLTKAMAEDPSAIAKLFTSEPFGAGTQSLTERFAAQLSSYTSNQGAIDTRVDGLNSSAKTLQGQQKQLENRLSQIEARYRQQFTALDSLIAQLNTTGTFLTQQIEALQNLNKQ